MPSVAANDLVFHVQELGAGPPLVMLHGLLIGSLASWYFTAAPALARSHRVRLFDLRGHGRSGPARTGYGVRSMAGDLAALSADLDGPIDLVGHSWGALVALRFALDHPGRVRRLALVEAPLPPSRAGQLTAFLDDLDPARVLDALPATLREAVAGGTRQAQRLLAALTVLLGETTLLADLRAEPDLDDAELATLACPALCVYGDRSACLPAGERLARVLPDARLTVLPGGHYLHLDARAALTTALEEHLGVTDVVANGVRMHVQRLGGGDRTVVFVHGLVMDNLSSYYFTLANPVATGAEVVLYDLRGHGLSERPPAGYAVPDLVADLAALLDALAIARPVHLVGNSVGGLVALAFAATHPARVASLALIDAHDGADGWAAQMTATLALRGEARDLKIAETFQSWLGRHSERKRTRLATAAQALVEGTSLVADLAASPPLTADSLARITCPVLALYGERSDVRDRGEALARTLPRCTLRLFPGCSHSVLWEATAEVRRQIVEWLTAPEVR